MTRVNKMISLLPLLVIDSYSQVEIMVAFVPANYAAYSC